jgi:hypothetical protein
MRTSNRGIWAVAVGCLLVLVGAPGSSLAADERDASVCQRSGQDAERQFDLPPGLLLSIGVVESGRLDPTTRRVAPWPWTIDANGVGQVFDNLADAVAATLALRARGLISIDVGCFQINLHQHPAAFATLEEAFDPSANAAYAARFLSMLRARTGSWEAATAAYHSSTQALGDMYRDSVLAVWTQPLIAPAAAIRPVATVLIWTPVADSKAVRIWRPDGPGLASAAITIRRPTDSVQPLMPAVHYGRFATDGRHSN